MTRSRLKVSPETEIILVPPRRANTKLGRSGTCIDGIRTRISDMRGGRHDCSGSKLRFGYRGEDGAPRMCRGSPVVQSGCVGDGRERLGRDRRDRAMTTVRRGRWCWRLLAFSDSRRFRRLVQAGLSRPTISSQDSSEFIQEHSGIGIGLLRARLPCPETSTRLDQGLSIPIGRRDPAPSPIAPTLHHRTAGPRGFDEGNRNWRW
jgi:hypothetical protein